MTAVNRRPEPAGRLALAVDRQKLADLVAESERRLASLADVQQQIAELRVETRSRDRSLSVALGPGGVLTGVTFHSEAYREMAPAELSSLISETAEKALREFVARTDELTAPMRPGATLPIDEIMAGDFDALAFLAESS